MKESIMESLLEDTETRLGRIQSHLKLHPTLPRADVAWLAQTLAEALKENKDLNEALVSVRRVLDEMSETVEQGLKRSQS